MTVTGLGVSLPVTTSILDAAPRDNDVSIVMVQHARADTAAFVKLLAARGFRIAAFVPIPYSTEPAAIEELRLVTEVIEGHELLTMPGTVGDAVRRESERSGSPVLVQEVGGYLADQIAIDPDVLDHVLGVVEETKQGLWRYQRLDNPRVPIVQIADSNLKRIESRHVGSSVALSGIERLRTYGEAVIGRHVGVLGYGDIGAHCARALRGLGNSVLVVDASPEKRLEAVSDGFVVVDLPEALARARILFGCTGSESLVPSDFSGASGRYYLASGSSRDVEFQSIVGSVTGSVVVDDDVELTLPASHGREEVVLTVLKGGFPVNFDNVSLPHSIIDLVFAQLAVGIRALIEDDLPSGVQGISAAAEREIAQRWMSSYGASSR